MAHIDESLLQSYLDDELEAHERARVDGLLAQHPASQARLDELRVMQRGLALALDARVNALSDGALWDRVEAALDAAPAPTRLGWGQRVRAWFELPRLELALAGGALAAAVAIVVWVRSSGSPMVLPVVAAPAPAETADNTLIVESYEVSEGTVVIDIQEDTPGAPAVVWHFVEEDGSGRPTPAETRG